MLNDQGRPTTPSTADAASSVRDTFTANRGLQIEEPLLFEIGRSDVTGVDLPAARSDAVATGTIARSRLGQHARKAPIDLPGLSEPETLRHYVRLSQKNYAIDSGIYPLGSCTMKHNPRINEKMARLPGFGDIHPLQPLSTVPGAIELIAELGRWLLEMTGMVSVAMSPKAGAHGELCGMMAIKAALEARGEKRRTVLVPELAHGTNPATAALLGYQVVDVPARADGNVGAEMIRAIVDEDVAAVMLTNPNTCGLFERDVVAIAEAVHAFGAFLYADGANFNAIVGKVQAGRSRRRRHAHQPPQDLLDAPWRRRPRRRPGGLLRTARALCAGALRPSDRRGRRVHRDPPRRRRGGASLRPHHRLSRPDGHVRAGAQLHALPRRRRHAAGLGGRGAQCQLYPRGPCRPHVAALRRPPRHARGAVRRCASSTAPGSPPSTSPRR